MNPIDILIEKLPMKKGIFYDEVGAISCHFDAGFNSAIDLCTQALKKCKIGLDVKKFIAESDFYGKFHRDRTKTLVEQDYMGRERYLHDAPFKARIDLRVMNEVASGLLMVEELATALSQAEIIKVEEEK